MYIRPININKNGTLMGRWLNLTALLAVLVSEWFHTLVRLTNLCATGYIIRPQIKVTSE